MGKAISIELGEKQQTILRQQLDSGRYENASEVVSDALRLMRERDTVFDDWLRTDVLASIADKQAPAPIDDVFKRVRSRAWRARRKPPRVAHKVYFLRRAEDRLAELGFYIASEAGLAVADG